MKNIFKYLILAILFFQAYSCTEDYHSDTVTFKGRVMYDSGNEARAILMIYPSEELNKCMLELKGGRQNSLFITEATFDNRRLSISAEAVDATEPDFQDVDLGNILPLEYILVGDWYIGRSERWGVSAEFMRN